MLGEIFYWMLNMSILGTVVGFIVLLSRKMKFLPKFVPYFLWAIPLIRLWIPFGLGYKYSLMNLISRVATKTVVVHEGKILPDFTMTNSIMAAEQYFPIIYKTNLLEDVFSVASMIWIIIAVAAILTAIALYVLTKSELRTATHLKENIFVTDKILSPAVFGIFRPKIVLPNYLVKRDTDYILLHERVHIKRADNLWRIVAVCTACLHWVNPFIWLFMKCFFEDMELSCDEKVLTNCGEGTKKAYAEALLDCEVQKTVFSSAFGGAKTKIRIEKILSYKKLTLFSCICFTVLIAIITLTLLTNAG